MLYTRYGCQLYPVVNTAGDTSGGLKGTGRLDGECEGPDFGSQVYSRTALYSGRWAIVYTWYFPKDVSSVVLPIFRTGVRHRWSSVVVWLDDVALETTAVLAVATSGPKGNPPGYFVESPVNRAYMDSNTVKVETGASPGAGRHMLVLTTEVGEFQDVILWDQMTDEAPHQALEITDFGEHTSVPFNNALFESNLRAAYG